MSGLQWLLLQSQWKRKEDWKIGECKIQYKFEIFDEEIKIKKRSKWEWWFLNS